MMDARPPSAGRLFHTFLPVGTEIAGYRVESFLGRGGMAVVYIATDLQLERRVALKLLAPELSEDHGFRERFLRESTLAASLEHPNIVPIYRAGEAEGVLYIAMRYVQGGDLDARLSQGGSLEPVSALALLDQVAGALDAAHAHGLVHRDVKPANILLTSSGGRAQEHVYLADFGLTKRTTSRSGFTATGQFVGTMNYVAPEQIAGKSLDPRSDLYALGCVAYQCLTGALPFVRDNEAALLWAHLMEMPAPLSTHRWELSPADPVIAKAVAKDPEDRYDSCGQFVQALAGSLEGLVPIDAVRRASRGTSLAHPPGQLEGPTAIGKDSPPPARSQPEAATVLVGQSSAPPSPRRDRRDAGSEGKRPVEREAGEGAEDLNHADSGPPRRPGARILVAAGIIALALLGGLLVRAATSGSSTPVATRAKAERSVAPSQSPSATTPVPPAGAGANAAPGGDARRTTVQRTVVEPPCRDLKAKGYRYSGVVSFWRTHGMPKQMDANHNNKPCETVYSMSEVSRYWKQARSVPAPAPQRSSQRLPRPATPPTSVRRKTSPPHVAPAAPPAAQTPPPTRPSPPAPPPVKPSHTTAPTTPTETSDTNTPAASPPASEDSDNDSSPASPSSEENSYNDSPTGSP